MPSNHADEIRQLKAELRELRDWTARIFTRFPTQIAAAAKTGFDRIEGRTVAAVAPSDPTFFIDNVVVTHGDENPLDDPDDPSEQLEVRNQHQATADAGALVKAEWQKNIDAANAGLDPEDQVTPWDWYQIDCPEEV